MAKRRETAKRRKVRVPAFPWTSKDRTLMLQLMKRLGAAEKFLTLRAVVVRYTRSVAECRLIRGPHQAVHMAEVLRGRRLKCEIFQHGRDGACENKQPLF
jgi:hypothetical protein